MILAEKTKRNIYVNQQDFVSDTQLTLISFVFFSRIINHYYNNI